MLLGFGKFLVLRMRRNNLEKTSNSSDAHSRRTLGGIPSEPYALDTSSFDRVQWTLRVENIGKGMGLEGGGSEEEEHWNRPRLNYSVKGC